MATSQSKRGLVLTVLACGVVWLGGCVVVQRPELYPARVTRHYGSEFGTEAAQASTAAPSEDELHRQLDPHGHWREAGDGGRCWVPDAVATDWRPYTRGQWVEVEGELWWEGDDPWGDVTYHYGNWYEDGRYGWVWRPGTVWAPAWVSWSFGGEYCGWAPMPPYPGPVPAAAYTFVPNSDLSAPRVYEHAAATWRNDSILRGTTRESGLQRVNGRPTNRGTVAALKGEAGARFESRVPRYAPADAQPGGVRAGGRYSAVGRPGFGRGDAAAWPRPADSVRRADPRPAAVRPPPVPRLSGTRSAPPPEATKATSTSRR